MHILAFFLIVIVAIFVMALAAIGSILRSIFGLGRRSNEQTNKRQGQYTYNSTGGRQQKDNTQQQKTSDQNSGNKHGKVFTEDEGEYVDFEEIKD